MADLVVVVCLAFDHRACAERLAQFKRCICQCPFVDSALEVAGSFDLIVHGRCASLAEYNENMERVRAQIAEFVSRLEANFVARRIESRAEPRESVVWLPCEGGRRRVDGHLIDKIVAEGDYMRVHVGDWSALVHQTMHQLCKQLGTANLIRLHRSIAVRKDFMERVTHKDHRWTVRLRDGTVVSIAKSHVREVLQLMTGESSTDEATSSIEAPTHRVI